MAWYLVVPGVWGPYDEQIRGGEMWEKEKQNGSCAVGKGRKGEMKMARSRLVGEVCLPPGATVTSVLGCCQGACLGPWCYSSQGLCSCLWLLLPSRAMLIPWVWADTWSLCWCPRVMLLLGLC